MPNIDQITTTLSAKLVLILDSDPEIISSIPISDVKEELFEIGIDPQPLVGAIGLSGQSVKDSDLQTTADVSWETKELLRAANEEVFEDGVDNELTKGLASLFERYNDGLINELTYLLLYKEINEEIASEILRWLGRLDDPSSQHDRLFLLEECLRNSSTRIRDAASVGLASLDDAHAIPFLQQAIQQEQCVELREDMEQVLAQLEATRRCHSS